jgi:uncharacterized protein (UPF0276 family)
MSAFVQRVSRLPVLGLGISTEYGAVTTPGAIDIPAFRAAYPAFAAFLEVGVETVKGLDDTADWWVQHGLPTTYHFLDLNLDEAEDFDAPWLDAVSRLTARMQPAWLCGDAGLWHFGRRERGHMLLLPPILSPEAARHYAAGIVRLRDHTGYEVFPENPPGQFYIGPWHILAFYAEVVERADTGFLLDCAHLAMYQQLMGHAPCTGLTEFPLERIVEIHVAGSTPREYQGYAYWDDDHTPQVLDPTWEIAAWVIPRAPNLKAVVFECERNTLVQVLPVFQRLAGLLAPTTLAAPGGQP